jgi:hypothetical protein
MKTPLTLTLTALPPYAWTGDVSGPFTNAPRELHRAAPLAQVTDTQVGAGLCGYPFTRVGETWWRVTDAAVRIAFEDLGLWALCGACLYLGGWPA